MQACDAAPALVRGAHCDSWTLITKGAAGRKRMSRACAGQRGAACPERDGAV